PGKHRRRGGLAVGTGDYENFFAAQEFLVEQLRERTEVEAVIEHMLKLDIAARDSVADDHKVRFGFEIPGIERLCHGNAEIAQEVRHRRVGSGIRPGYIE